MLFANDFVGISDSKESLQKLADVIYSEHKLLLLSVIILS